MDRVLDWVPRFDEQSKQYPIRSLLTERPTRRNRRWTSGPIIDQGNEGACVGFGWTAEALASPVRVNLNRVKAAIPREPNAFAQNLYNTAKTLDDFEGVNYDGTSVLAGAKAMQQYGLLKEYRWAFNINDVVDAILTKGPVVLGIYWYDGMYEAPDGVLRITGDIIGGHCITAVGYKVNSQKTGEDSVILQNSWGTSWGLNGIAEISVTDLATLLDNDGEACVPSKRSYGR